jgi:tetratricopeptide (TPR) repeat protein
MYTDIEIHHRKPPRAVSASTRNIDIYTAIEVSGKEFTPRQQYYFARELKDHAQWAKAAYYFEKFLDGGRGWVEDNIGSCYNLSLCYNQLGDFHKVLPVLLRSFHFDAPRAEICSEIGYYFKRLKNYPASLKWFDLATKVGKPHSAGFILWDYYGYIPNIECCVCCSEMGDFKTAHAYNERAAEYKLTPAIEQNRNFLKTKMEMAV